jgi:hypothetical protein
MARSLSGQFAKARWEEALFSVARGKQKKDFDRLGFRVQPVKERVVLAVSKDSCCNSLLDPAEEHVRAVSLG